MVKRILSTAVAVTALTAGPASASIISVEDVSGTWTDTAPGSAVTGEGGSEITWGHPAKWYYDQSGYEFQGAAPPSQPVTEDKTFDLGAFIHSNYPIYGESLESAELTIDTEVQIDGVNGMVSSVYEFSHWETPNAAHPCPYQGDKWWLNWKGCADQVTFERNESASKSFTVNGTDYQVDISGFHYGNELAEEFWTKEKSHNYATLKGVVTAKASVPEPGTLVLLGTGLLGLAGVRRARRD